MSTKSKLEGRITVPVGGWDIAVVETGGGGLSDTVNVPAGEYYLSSGDTLADSLIEELEDQFALATLATAYTVTIDAGEEGTGKVTITSDGATGVTSVAITWTDTDMRDVLGFESDGNLSGSLSYTSTEQARSLWISDTTYNAFNHDGAGWQESDFRAQESTGSGSFTFFGNKKRVNALRFRASLRSRAFKENEITIGESWERFWEDVVLGDVIYSSRSGGPLRWYPDADDDATFFTFIATEGKDFKPEAVRETWVGLWTLELPRLIRQD